MRAAIRAEVEGIVPVDAVEAAQREEVIAWIRSGAELCRRAKPATPPKHLVSYFVVVDGDQILLVDHRNARLWLPTGGHVEPGEHPRDTVMREAEEELGLDAVFVLPQPLFVTSTETVGLTAGHVDVSLWYVLRGDRRIVLHWDPAEFNAVCWFHRSAVPLERSDPHMGRFLAKLAPHL
jgi:8-oxo-dGTP diphosphatase